MRKSQKKKTPVYPWDSISVIPAAVISLGVVMGVDALLVVSFLLY